MKNRSDNVGLGLEVLVQSLAQEDIAYRAVTMKVVQLLELVLRNTIDYSRTLLGLFLYGTILSL